MRDISDYEKNYINMNESFERYKVKYRREKIIEQIEYYNPTKILEIGCGLEPLFSFIQNKNFTVVEPSAEFYENAQKLKDNLAYDNLTCIKGFFEDVFYKLADLVQTYDMIICSSLLHEVTIPETLLRAITKVCSVDTVVHINVPNAYSLHRLIGAESGILTSVFDKTYNNRLFQQNQNFDMASLKRILNACNMIVIDEGSYFLKPFSHKQMAEMLDKHILDEKILDALYGVTRHMPEFGSEIYVNCKIKG